VQLKVGHCATSQHVFFRPTRAQVTKREMQLYSVKVTKRMVPLPYGARKHIKYYGTIRPAKMVCTNAGGTHLKNQHTIPHKT
jgi:hypothetical protein